VDAAKRKTLNRRKLMSRYRRTYREDEELTEYVWHNYRHLMDDAERLVERAILAEEKASADGCRIAEVLRQRWVGNDPCIAEALREGVPAFRARVRDRLLREHADEIAINRCPACGRIVASPKARQCLWCGHDWHDAIAR
jgi:hypothetical protein